MQQANAEPQPASANGEERSRERYLVVGKVSGLFGVQGWVKLFSYTEPRQQILHYSPLYLRRSQAWQPLVVEGGQAHGKGVIAKFERYDDRDGAAQLMGRELAIKREQLPPLGPGEYYWSDLQELRVVTVGGVELGQISHLFATGSNDVMVVKGERERLVPFIQGECVKSIDLAKGEMVVDWDPDF